jgi:hypothetical protein
MNWFDRSIVKTSAYNQEEPPPPVLNWMNQTDDYMMFGDLQRYVFDSQTVKIFLTKTKAKWTVSLMTNHTYLGTAGFSIFWSFDLDKGDTAKKVFGEVGTITREIIKDFVANETPTSIFYPTLRAKLQTLEERDLIKTNIPVINYSYDIEYADDWRKTIYGPRYPTYKEESFKQYLNSSIYSQENPPTGKFAL